MQKLEVNGYQVIRFEDEEEPRIPSAEIAKRIGIEERILKKRIKRYLAAGELRNTRIEIVERVPGPSKDMRGRPIIEYYLCEHDCLYVIVKSETETSNAITHEVIDVFINARKGITGRADITQALEQLVDTVSQLAQRVKNLESRPPVHINLPNDTALPLSIERKRARRRSFKILKFPEVRDLALKMLREGSAYCEVAAAIQSAWPEHPERHIGKSSLGRFWIAARTGALKEFGIDVTTH